ncbi:uncharacterized protein LOC120503980 isoform X1 [Passer montanus]|uniref:uncharacterized protein LOC120503980 isoform X1 n=1 Tax=Passer montanus TaxID=9160 RepID=UPI00196150E1|nr:uncharacterized protein LOC120503980 isoform X1 [Passer montanus]
MWDPHGGGAPLPQEPIPGWAGREIGVKSSNFGDAEPRFPQGKNPKKGYFFHHCGDAQPSFPRDKPQKWVGGSSRCDPSRRAQNSAGSGGIRTHAPAGTGALIQRLRPLGHATPGAGRGRRRPGGVWGHWTMEMSPCPARTRDGHVSWEGSGVTGQWRCPRVRPGPGMDTCPGTDSRVTGQWKSSPCPARTGHAVLGGSGVTGQWRCPRVRPGPGPDTCPGVTGRWRSPRVRPEPGVKVMSMEEFWGHWTMEISPCPARTRAGHAVLGSLDMSGQDQDRTRVLAGVWGHFSMEISPSSSQNQGRTHSPPKSAAGKAKSGAAPPGPSPSKKATPPPS